MLRLTPLHAIVQELQGGSFVVPKVQTVLHKTIDERNKFLRKLFFNVLLQFCFQLFPSLSVRFLFLFIIVQVYFLQCVERCSLCRGRARTELKRG
jgi:hypothetical protein